MKTMAILVYIFLFFTGEAFAGASVSPILYFLRDSEPSLLAKMAHVTGSKTAPVTVRFSFSPDSERILELEDQGLIFKRDNGRILQTKHIYTATVHLDSLETLAHNEDIIRIESTFRPSCSSTLNISNPQVQASLVWESTQAAGTIDGSGIILTNIDTGIDIFHPGFFKPDGGTYEWIDVNNSGKFESGVDAVDLNSNGKPDTDETLNFFDASFSDPLGLMDRTEGVYDADIDWLYNDYNGNGFRDFGHEGGYSEQDPSFGELLFIITEINRNNRLDPGESLTALGTSKILATFDKNGKHYRNIDLFESTGDVINHGTGACGIAGGQSPGRRLAGMAPGIEFISINRTETDIEEAIIWAKNLGTNIMMYEFASWVYEFLDGTSNFEVLINELYDEGIHQFTASGNLAGPKRKKHAFVTLQNGEQDSVHFNAPNIGIGNVYLSILWSGRNYSPEITLLHEDSGSLLLKGNIEKQSLGTYSVYSGIDISPKNTKRMDILIESEEKIYGDMTLVFKNESSSGLDIDLYVSDNVTHWMNGTQFRDHVTDDGTVCSPGTSEKGITVGAYDPRGTRNIMGDINDFSSWGNTIDGRRSVDITAPGTLVYSLTSHDAAGGQPGGDIDFGGTSSALPHAAGCASLILQASPDISPDELSSVLFLGALSDNFTGKTPNSIWGYGKLRVLDYFITTNITIDENILPAVFSVSANYPNPFNTSTSFRVDILKNSSSFIDLFVYNLLGQKIRTIRTTVTNPGTAAIIWNGKNDKGIKVASGVYYFQFLYNDFSISKIGLLLK